MTLIKNFDHAERTLDEMEELQKQAVELFKKGDFENARRAHEACRQLTIDLTDFYTSVIGLSEAIPQMRSLLASIKMLKAGIEHDLAKIEKAQAEAAGT